MSDVARRVAAAALSRTYDRPVVGHLHVTLKTGESWRASRLEVERFGWVDPHIVMRRFADALVRAVRESGQSTSDDELAVDELALLPVVRLLRLVLSGLDIDETALTERDPIDQRLIRHEVRSVLDAVAAAERALRGARVDDRDDDDDDDDDDDSAAGVAPPETDPVYVAARDAVLTWPPGEGPAVGETFTVLGVTEP